MGRYVEGGGHEDEAEVGRGREKVLQDDQQEVLRTHTFTNSHSHSLTLTLKQVTSLTVKTVKTPNRQSPPVLVIRLTSLPRQSPRSLLSQ